MTGVHETSSIHNFSYGTGNRAASFRIPTQVMHDNGKGYVEDRRPASNIDPYIVTAIVFDTSCIENSQAEGMVEHYRNWTEWLPNSGIPNFWGFINRISFISIKDSINFLIYFF